jgi:hypothetical protein
MELKKSRPSDSKGTKKNL